MSTTISIQPNGPRARAVDAMRRLILDGVWQEGDRLPSEASMAQRLSVSRATLRKALDELEGRGLLRRERHRGCVVSERPPQPSALVSQSVVVISDTAEQRGDQPPAGTSSEAKAALLDAFARQGRNTVVVPRSAIDEPFIRQLLSERPQGLVLFGWIGLTDAMRGVARACIGAGIPVVAYCSAANGEETIPFDRVTSDHESGTVALVRWLHERGRSRILRLWTGSPEHPAISMHNQGYERACRELGIEPVPAVYVADLPDRDAADAEVFQRRTRCMAGYLAEQLREPDPIEAIMVVTDCETFNATAACRLLGREPNRDVLIAGYDNYWANAPERQFEPTFPAATVDKANRAIGDELARLLELRLNGSLESDEPIVRRLPQRLMEVADIRSDPERLD